LTPPSIIVDPVISTDNIKKPGSLKANLAPESQRPSS